MSKASDDPPIDFAWFKQLRTSIETAPTRDRAMNLLRKALDTYPVEVKENYNWLLELASLRPDIPIVATPFTWRPQSEIPTRRWLYGRHLLRKFVSVDVAAGGLGKSSLKIGEALCMAANRPYYGHAIHEGELRVWIYNLEDPADETERRIHATAERFGLKAEDFGDRLFVDSGRDQALVIAFDDGRGATVASPVVEALMQEIKSRKIDVLIVDPFVSSHAITENDNTAIDMVAKQWSMIADECNCAINLVHHVRKTQTGEVNADSARGASSLIGAARSVMVYNRMTAAEAGKAGIDEGDARFFFRVDNDKANLAPAGSATWYRMNNVELANGDHVGVACLFKMPNPFDGLTSTDLMRVQKAVAEGEWREHASAKAWVGVPIAMALSLDVENKNDAARIKQLIIGWTKEGILEVVENTDKNRIARKFVVVGNWITE